MQLEDGQPQSWRLLRIRTDKSLPNHVSVYQRVCDSIRDDITLEQIYSEVASFRIT